MVLAWEMEGWDDSAERRAFMGVSESICLARFVEGCLSSGWSSSSSEALCLGIVRDGWCRVFLLCCLYVLFWM